MNLHVASRRAFFQSAAAAAALPRLLAAQEPPIVREGLVRLSLNESPYGPFPSAMRAMVKALERGNRYPRQEARALRKRLADVHGVPQESLVLGVGSSEPLRVATEVFCSPGHPPVTAEPTFEAVAHAARIAHIQAVKVPLTAPGVHDIEKMIDTARRNSAGLIYLCNPANPTATIIARDQLAWAVAKLPPDTVLLSDEAYLDFVDDPRYESALSHVKQGRRVIVLRTFSKLYGLAGMRLGYALAPPELIARMTPLMLGSIGLNQAVIAAAGASLDDKPAYDRVRSDNARVRKFVIESFREMGYSCLDSQANFLMADLWRPVAQVTAQLETRGFAVARMFASMPNHLRITFGTMADMQRFMPALREILSAA
jgi:histidinol-phosphate aminotransferase